MDYLKGHIDKTFSPTFEMYNIVRSEEIRREITTMLVCSKICQKNNKSFMPKDVIKYVIPGIMKKEIKNKFVENFNSRKRHRFNLTWE